MITVFAPADFLFKNLRITNAVLSNKHQEALAHIAEIKKQYAIVQAELRLYEEKYPSIKDENVKEAIRVLKEEPDKIKTFKKRYNRISLLELTKLFDSYLALNKKAKSIEDDYYVTTGFNISDSIDVVNIFNVLIEYYNKYRGKGYATDGLKISPYDLRLIEILGEAKYYLGKNTMV